MSNLKEEVHKLQIETFQKISSLWNSFDFDKKMREALIDKEFKEYEKKLQKLEKKYPD